MAHQSIRIFADFLTAPALPARRQLTRVNRQRTALARGTNFGDQARKARVAIRARHGIFLGILVLPSHPSFAPLFKLD
jgi:hypothetical protein